MSNKNNQLPLMWADQYATKYENTFQIICGIELHMLEHTWDSSGEVHSWPTRFN